MGQSNEEAFQELHEHKKMKPLQMQLDEAVSYSLPEEGESWAARHHLPLVPGKNSIKRLKRITRAERNQGNVKPILKRLN